MNNIPRAPSHLHAQAALLGTGHFSHETHAVEIAGSIARLLANKSSREYIGGAEPISGSTSSVPCQLVEVPQPLRDAFTFGVALFLRTRVMQIGNQA
jgi:hypothetical protein